MTLTLIGAILMGIGATLIFDLWAQFLKLTFKMNASNICLVGRWVRYMPEGTFKHSSIASAPRKSAECAVGWITHYVIGIGFAVLFVLLAGSNWLQHPTLIPALLFGLVTVVAPFFILQPLTGLGIAASKAPRPAQARVRSLMNHAAFGFGLYLSALLLSGLLRGYA